MEWKSSQWAYGCDYGLEDAKKCLEVKFNNIFN